MIYLLLIASVIMFAVSMFLKNKLFDYISVVVSAIALGVGFAFRQTLNHKIIAFAIWTIGTIFIFIKSVIAICNFFKKKNTLPNADLKIRSNYFGNMTILVGVNILVLIACIVVLLKPLMGTLMGAGFLILSPKFWVLILALAPLLLLFVFYFIILGGIFAGATIINFTVFINFIIVALIALLISSLLYGIVCVLSVSGIVGLKKWQKILFCVLCVLPIAGIVIAIIMKVKLKKQTTYEPSL